LDFSAGSCIKFGLANVPAFESSSSSNRTTEELNQLYQLVPVLTRDAITRIKMEALLRAGAAAEDREEEDTDETEGGGSVEMAPTSNGDSTLMLDLPYIGNSTKRSNANNSTKSSDDNIASDTAAWRTVNANSGFVHPGTCAGPAELAFMLQQLRNASEPQTSALHSLLTGLRVPPKVMDAVSGWAPPTDCSPDNYTGPYPMPVALIRCGGSMARNTHSDSRHQCT
jgi:hypothetical protein